MDFLKSFEIIDVYKSREVDDTTTNIQSCEQDMTLSKPGQREYQIWWNDNDGP